MIRKPDLRVINQAISRIENGKDLEYKWERRHSKYSCLAIDQAVAWIHFRLPFTQYDSRGGVTYPRQAVQDQYKKHYKAFVKAQNGGRLPRWWNDVHYGRHWRISALKAFKQACINAAKKQQKVKK